MRSIPPGETSVLQNYLLQVSEAPRYRRTTGFSRVREVDSTEIKPHDQALRCNPLFVQILAY